MNVVEEIALRLDSEEKKYGKASFVVCGGRSVAQVFNKLSLIDINWQNIIITLADNRLVDRNLKDNNETVVFESLLKNHAANAKFIPLDTKLLSNKELNLPFSVTLLSMGEDGHFASIFPEMITEKNSINPEGFPEILTTKPLGCPKYSRITMNLPLILQSKSIFLLVHGEKKINTLKLAQSNLTLPVSSLLSAAREKLIIDKINT